MFSGHNIIYILSKPKSIQHDKQTVRHNIIYILSKPKSIQHDKQTVRHNIIYIYYLNLNLFNTTNKQCVTLSI